MEQELVVGLLFGLRKKHPLANATASATTDRRFSTGSSDGSRPGQTTGAVNRLLGRFVPFAFTRHEVLAGQFSGLYYNNPLGSVWIVTN